MAQKVPEFAFWLKMHILKTPQLFIGRKSWRHHVIRCVFQPLGKAQVKTGGYSVVILLLSPAAQKQ
jgi:hypothetical protein